MAKEQDFYFKFSFNNLKHRKLRSWLTMIGIFIGIASVVALIGMGEGLRTAINSQFGFLGTDILSITASGGLGPPGTGVVDPLTDKEKEKIENIAGLEGVAGRLIESGKINFNRKTGFSYVGSMPDGEEREIIEKAMNIEIERGRKLKDSDSGVAMVGYQFSEEDNTFGKQMVPGSKIRLQEKEYEVIGILEKKGNQLIDGIILINENDMRELFERDEDDFDIIVAKVKENIDPESIKPDIEKELRKLRDVDEGEEDFSVNTPSSTLESVNSIITGIQIFVYIIAGISILVGGIGIMNTMYTAVVERTREIGIMKSIGSENSTIFTLFFIESGLIGTVGGLVGALIGAIAAKGFAFIGRLALRSDLISAEISPYLIIGALLFSFILGSFFGTLPAYQASKLNPVEALRYSK